MFVVIHDAVHNTIFKTPLANKWVAILADLPNTFPTAMGFRCYHQKHHSHLGDYDYDADLPGHIEAQTRRQPLVRQSLLALRLRLLAAHPARPPERHRADAGAKWTYINAAVDHRLRSRRSLFLRLERAALSLRFVLVFGRRLHPLGARWIQEHFTFDPQQETYDYYGPLNLVALNIGYHNEHHDFPEIPWRAAARTEADGAGILRPT